MKSDLEGGAEREREDELEFPSGGGVVGAISPAITAGGGSISESEREGAGEGAKSTDGFNKQTAAAKSSACFLATSSGIDDAAVQETASLTIRSPLLR